MKTKLRPVMLELIAALKEEGMELGSDIASISVIYPEHPEVVVNLAIGGMFFDDEENIEVH